MALIVHAPVPTRAFNMLKAPSAIARPPSHDRRRRTKTPRDIMNATEKSISLTYVAHRLYYDTCISAIITENAVRANEGLANDVPTHSPEFQKRPALRRRNAMRVIRPTTRLLEHEATTETSVPFAYAVHNSFPFEPSTSIRAHRLGDGFLSLCAVVASIMLDGSHDTRPGNKRATLRRKHSMCPLRPSEGIHTSALVEKTSPTSTLAEVQEHSSNDERITPSPMVAVPSCMPSAIQLANFVDSGYQLPDAPVTASGNGCRGLTQIIKEYWQRTCRPGPAARGRPTLATINEDTSSEDHSPSCGIFGHAMVRAKGKQPTRRVRARPQN